MPHHQHHHINHASSLSLPSQLQAVAQDIDAISPEYIKQLILLVYELTVNYITAMLAQPDFDLAQYLSALFLISLALTHRVHFTQVQTAPRCYLQLMCVWSAVLDCVLQRAWSATADTTSPVEDSIQAELPGLLQHLLGVLQTSSNHPVLCNSDRSEEYLEESGEACEGSDGAGVKEEVDELTGDFEETPAQILTVVTEYDHVLEKSFVVVSKLMTVPEVRAACSEGVFALLMQALQTAMGLLGGGGSEAQVEEACVMVRLLSYLDFDKHNIEVLSALSAIIQWLCARELTGSECYVSNVYLNGKTLTQFYINTLLCFKQYIYLLNNQLDGADIESIITSLYSTITQPVTVPPNLLLITISHLLIYLASNCAIHNLSNLACRLSRAISPLVMPSLTTSFTKATAQCPLVIQKQLLLFALFLLVHNLNGDDLHAALSSLLLPLLANLQANHAVSPTQRRAPAFRFGGSSASVVSSSVFSRSVYLLTAVIRVSSSMNKTVRSVLYPELMSSLQHISQCLIESCERNDSSTNYENCRIMWNFVIYCSSIFRSHKESYAQFYSITGALLQQLPNMLSHITNSVKSVLCTWYKTD